MADLNNIAEEYSRIIDELEKNITDTENLDYAKAKLSELFMLFLEKIDNLVDKYEGRLECLANNQIMLDKKVQKVEGILEGIEKDIYEDSVYDFEIICPYCNNQFTTEFEESNTEIECPECKNVIELEWGEDLLGCEGGHDGCNGHSCSHQNEYTEEDDDDL